MLHTSICVNSLDKQPFLSLEDDADLGEISKLQPHAGVNTYAKTKPLEISSSGRWLKPIYDFNKTLVITV